MNRETKPPLTTAGGGVFGLSFDFPWHEPELVVEVLRDAGSLRVEHLRTPIDISDWRHPQGRAWLEWLIPTLASRCEILPCLTDTGHDEAFSDHIAEFADVLGAHFHAVELRGPSLPVLRAAAARLRAVGKRAVLGIDGTMPESIDGFDVIGFATESESAGDRFFGLPIWVTEAGCGPGTGDHAVREPLETFLSAWQAPFERVYWRGSRDRVGTAGDAVLRPGGLRDRDGAPKLLFRLLADSGPEAVRSIVQPTRRPVPADSGSMVLITGGAGFIGTNLADRLLREGHRVLLFDSLARPGTEGNLRWLMERHPERMEFFPGDVRDMRAIRKAVARAGSIFHFAAQVAVTTSLDDPAGDFEHNARGTLNVLEAVRSRDTPPPLLFTSTNKVYGGLDDLLLYREEEQYAPRDPAVRQRGVGETRPLEFCSPYGCSKGAADQYVLDYARTFGLPMAVFRMSCIYGPRQFGTEDQGWVAHFLIQALRGKPITVYGDGFQVRDVLYVDDLVSAMLTARAQMPSLAGQAFNIGGGPGNTLSLQQLLAMIESMQARAPAVRYEGWRASDQRYYVSDTTRFSTATGWKPLVAPAEGVQRLHQWLAEQYGAATATERRAAP